MSDVRRKRQKGGYEDLGMISLSKRCVISFYPLLTPGSIELL